FRRPTGGSRVFLILPCAGFETSSRTNWQVAISQPASKVFSLCLSSLSLRRVNSTPSWSPRRILLSTPNWGGAHDPTLAETAFSLQPRLAQESVPPCSGALAPSARRPVRG